MYIIYVCFILFIYYLTHYPFSINHIYGIRISSNWVELIFVKVHLSTFRASRDAVFWILLSAKGFDPGGLLQ